MLHWLGRINPNVPLIITIPHSGETVPPEAGWLNSASEQLLLTDVDRFVDKLYEKAVTELSIPALITKVHRYAADLNRYPTDVDQDSVIGAKEPSGAYTKGFHWVESTLGERIMHAPIEQDTHDAIVAKYHDSFHEEFAARLSELKDKFPGRAIYHLDCHSMPSVGTGAHDDNGQKRAEVVISDFEGKSSSTQFKDLVTEAFEAQGFETAYNWPYKGGRITQRYGKPAQNHHTIQIELNRALYMNEQTKEKLPGFQQVADRLHSALARILTALPGI